MVDGHGAFDVSAAITLTLVAVAIADSIILFRWACYYLGGGSHPQNAQTDRHETEIEATTMDLSSQVWAEVNDTQGESSYDSPVHERPLNVTISPSQILNLKPPKSPFAPTWSLVDPFIALQLALIFAAAAIIVPLKLFAVFAGQSSRDLLQNRIATLLDSSNHSPISAAIVIYGLVAQNLAFVGVVVYYLKRYGVKLSDLGFAKPTKRQILSGLLLGLILVKLSDVVSQAAHWVIGNVFGPYTLKAIEQAGDSIDAGSVFRSLHGAAQLMFLLAGALLAPIGEEIFFRGFLFTSIARRTNLAVAMIISGLAFALLHCSVMALIVIWPMGIALAYVYHRTGSLWVTIVMHAVNNSFAFGVILWQSSGH